MAEEGKADYIDGAKTIFARDRVLGAYITEGMDTIYIVEAAGDFLLDFCHSHVAFDEIVVIRDAEVM